MRRMIAVGAIALLGLGGLAGCGDDEESQATAETNLCTSLSTFSASVVSLQGLDPQTASQTDYEDAVRQIQVAWDDVREDAEGVVEADTAALDGARAELESAVDDAPDDVPVADAVSGLEDEVTQIAQTWRELYDGLGCATLANADEPVQ